MSDENDEKLRLSNLKWKKWGPYMSERQWGTVREDYGSHGDSWSFVSHDKARSNAYRWGEDGIAGFCDPKQILCLAPAFWNENDPILKERLFGLTNSQGNHGEDVKELYFHLDSSPTHSYCKYLYKYPQAEFPYSDLALQNQKSRDESEYELLDTGIFDENKYFDCFIEYAKAGTEDILNKITVINRGPEPATIHILPHLWYRNYWKHNPKYDRPIIKLTSEGKLTTHSPRNGNYHYYFEQGQSIFCDNETNNVKIYNFKNESLYVKDGINDHVINKSATVNPNFEGTKVAIWSKHEIPPGGQVVIRSRFSKHEIDHPWEEFESIIETRQRETDLFYQSIIPSNINEDKNKVVRSALSGLLWGKQFYYLDQHKWLFGGPGEVPPQRSMQRNYTWQHLNNRNIISMPDKWEYPWYAAWDLAFHATSFVRIDPDFAKNQLELMLSNNYMHPNGQIPAYEWNFSDVNPPVHSWAVWEVFQKDKEATGIPDYTFLSGCFNKLLINFTWWVNQKDIDGLGLFEGGFLGLDNIGVFDRNHMPKGIKRMQQADATSWMALFALNMVRMSLELTKHNPTYEDLAIKFVRQFLNIGWSMHNIGGKDVSLWDEQDSFYYDVVQMENGHSSRLKVRSLVGIIPLFAVEVIHTDLISGLKEFIRKALQVIQARPDLASLISRIEETNDEGYHLFSIMRGFRLEHVLKRLLDENEFLSPFGIRSLSKYHEEHPFIFKHFGMHKIEYVPGESKTSMFGGNSNWRGPIWFPLNYLIIRSLLKFYKYFGPTYIYEFPTGSGTKLNLKQIAKELTNRLLRIFQRDENGKYQYHTADSAHKFTTDPHFKDLHLFYEFFDGENGRGLGASHQTGWTALIANLLLELEDS